MTSVDAFASAYLTNSTGRTRRLRCHAAIVSTSWPQRRRVTEIGAHAARRQRVARRPAAPADTLAREEWPEHKRSRSVGLRSGRSSHAAPPQRGGCDALQLCVSVSLWW